MKRVGRGAREAESGKSERVPHIFEGIMAGILHSLHFIQVGIHAGCRPGVGGGVLEN